MGVQDPDDEQAELCEEAEKIEEDLKGQTREQRARGIKEGYG